MSPKRFVASDLEWPGGNPRPASLARARDDFLAGRFRPATIEKYPDTRWLLADGRHRLVTAHALGISEYPAWVRRYDRTGRITAEWGACIRPDVSSFGDD